MTGASIALAVVAGCTGFLLGLGLGLDLTARSARAAVVEELIAAFEDLAQRHRCMGKQDTAVGLTMARNVAARMRRRPLPGVRS
jgi:hypothetical protein